MCNDAKDMKLYDSLDLLESNKSTTALSNFVDMEAEEVDMHKILDSDGLSECTESKYLCNEMKY